MTLTPRVLPPFTYTPQPGCKLLNLDPCIITRILNQLVGKDAVQLHPEVLQTCRQLYRNAQQVLYGEHRIKFDMSRDTVSITQTSSGERVRYHKKVGDIKGNILCLIRRFLKVTVSISIRSTCGWRDFIAWRQNLIQLNQVLRYEARFVFEFADERPEYTSDLIRLALLFLRSLHLVRCYEVSTEFHRAPHNTPLSVINSVKEAAHRTRLVVTSETAIVNHESECTKYMQRLERGLEEARLGFRMTIIQPQIELYEAMVNVDGSKLKKLETEGWLRLEKAKNAKLVAAMTASEHTCSPLR